MKGSVKVHLQIHDLLIPGTKLRRSDMNDVTGMEFLSKIFFISDGVMLTQIRDISGIDGSTLQNWTKRGWVPLSKSKKYDIDQVAYILIINMLRPCMQLDKIAYMLEYINGDLEDTSDDIITDSLLYDYICRILETLMHRDICSMASIKDVIAEQITDYEEVMPGARQRLANALEIIVVAYYAALIKRRSDNRSLRGSKIIYNLAYFIVILRLYRSLCNRNRARKGYYRNVILRCEKSYQLLCGKTREYELVVKLHTS